MIFLSWKLEFIFDDLFLMTTRHCPECSGIIVSTKDSEVCSRCGLIVETRIVFDDGAYKNILDHAPLWTDKQAIEMYMQKYRNDNREWCRLQQRINERFSKKAPHGYRHCERCGLFVSIFNPEKHVCTLESITRRNLYDKTCQLYRSGKTISEISTELHYKERTTKWILVKNGLIEKIGTGNTRCKKCGAIVSSAHGKDFHVCGSHEHEKKRRPYIDDKIPCFLHDLGSCGGMFKMRVSISGKSIAQELKIPFYSNAYIYSEDIISQLNDPTRFVICCASHANQIRALRIKHRMKFDRIIEMIKKRDKINSSPCLRLEELDVKGLAVIARDLRPVNDDKISVD